MSGRGEYTAIHTALLDAPDFQELTPSERLMVFTLKLTLGPSGIALMRFAALQLGQLSGLDREETEGVLDGLTTSGWLHHQGDVLWLTNGLKHNPNFTLKNEKHRTSIDRHLNGLPQTAIINAYAEYYGLPSPAEGMGIEWVSIPYTKQVVGTRYTEEVTVKGSVSKDTGQQPDVENSEGDFCALVRKYLWQSKTPPSKKWSMKNEISIRRALVKQGEDPEVINGVVAQYQGEPATMRLYWAKEARQQWSIGKGRYLQSLPPAKKPLSATKLGDVLEGMSA